MQINVTDRQYLLLRDESERTGLPISELVRRAIDGVYRPGSRLRVRGLEVNVGLFRHPDATWVGRERRPWER